MCNISRSFEIKNRSEITDYGSYRPGILFGSFSKEDLELIFAFAIKCDYSVVVSDSSFRTVRIENKITGRWGWLKKVWACIDTEKDLYAAQFVYGFFQGRSWRTKYCINENFIAIRDRIVAKRTLDHLDNSVWPYCIYLPELEPEPVRDKIARIRGSVRKIHT